MDIKSEYDVFLRIKFIYLVFLLFLITGCGREYYLNRGNAHDRNKDYFKARIYYEEAAKKGDNEAYYMLGHYYYEGLGVSKDYKLSLYWLQKEYENDSIGYNGILKIALIYNSGGYGIDANKKLASKYFLEAEKGIARQIDLNPESALIMIYAGEAYLKMGEVYKTIKLWKRSIELAPREELTNNKEFREVAHKSLDELQKFYYENAKLGAERDNPRAQYNLGFAYCEGIGVEKNLQEASRWFDKAAEHNDPRVLYKLGNLYHENKVIKQDVVKAKQYFTRVLDLPDDNEIKKKAQGKLDSLIEIPLQGKDGVFVQQPSDANTEAEPLGDGVLTP